MISKKTIVFFIYNRPETTEIVFSKIREYQPNKIYIFSDGPKNEDDKLNVERARNHIQIDWACESVITYHTKNFGCSASIINGLNKVFNEVEDAIILEDDCNPDFTFFEYCHKLLDFYKEDSEVLHISGFNPLAEVDINNSYFFSKFILPPWGWATWKRAWKNFNSNLDTWQKIKTITYQNINQEYFKDWTDMFENIRLNKTTWDVPWNVDIWKYKGLGIIPKKSLVKNIGFGYQATFTHNISSELSKIEAQKMRFPIQHPLKRFTDFDGKIEKILIENIRLNSTVN